MAEIHAKTAALTSGVRLFGVGVNVSLRAVACLLAVMLSLAPGVPLEAHGQTQTRARTQQQPGASGARSSSASPPGSGLSVPGNSVHISCTRSLRDLTKNREECFGNVYIRRANELLTADYAVMDLNTKQLHAEGNVVYFTPDTVIYGEKMDFNFETETGVVTDGRVESDKYTLLGERIERVGPNHFIAQDGEYTTCRDCPASWKLVGRNIDLTVDGYAYLSQVFIKLNEAPTLYLPYAIIPVKTRRQTGLLFPRTGFNQNGFNFNLPFFWAISRSMDATFGLGFLSLRGLKGEGEFRYALGPRSSGSFNFYYLRDRQFIGDPYYNRWAINSAHMLELPGGLEAKFNYLDASDRDYARNIGDIPGRGEPALVSTASISRSWQDLSAWVTANRIHNQLTPGLTGFDNNTVQLLPGVSFATSDLSVINDKALRWRLSANYSRFDRQGPSFDPIFPVDAPSLSPKFFIAGQTPLRRAQRLMLVPEIYHYSLLADAIEFMPSLQYRAYGYTFDPEVANPTARGYLLAQAEVGTTIERVYGGSFKHKLRPSLSYSNIPLVQQNPGHPFIRQLRTSGNQFDEFDIVPISNDTQLYFVPLGNSLAYQFSNKIITKEDDGTYRKVLDVISGQSINFREYKKLENPQPYSRFYTLFNVETRRVTARGEYYYYPYIRQPTYSLSTTYVFARYMRRLLAFDRSVTINYNYNQVTSTANSVGGMVSWSVNDYFSVLAGIDYRFPVFQNNRESPGVIQAINGGVTYQSPSQCYKLVLLASRTVDNPKVAITFNIPVNLTGEGYANLQEGGGLVGNQQQGGGIR